MAKIWEGIGISKTYQNHTALEPLTICFTAGECASLCGGNGAGKSTLLQLIAGVLTPSSGSIHLAPGTKISYMPDRLEFPSKITAYEFLLFIAKMKQCTKQEVLSKLAKVGLDTAAEKQVATFSKGMQQRLLLAQAMLGDPDILLLDEPGNGLDPYWIDLWKKILHEYKEMGKTVIFSSHVLHDVVDVADRVLLFNQGKMIDDSPVVAWKEAGRNWNELFLEKLADG